MDIVTESEAIEGELRAIGEHWNSIEAQLGRNFLLQGGYGRTNFLQDAAKVAQHNATLIAQENALVIASGKRDSGRTNLRTRFDALRTAITAKFPTYLSALPHKPGATSGEKVLLKAAEDALDVWTRIESDPEIVAALKPLTIQSGYTKTQLGEEISELKAAFVAVENAKRAATETRGARDRDVKAVRGRAIQYRNLVLAELPSDHSLRRTLP